jgi:DNA-binding PadR family transcriptional regulator
MHGLEEGLLASEKRVVEGKVRKYYHLTPAGEEALNPGREKAIELLDEIWDEPIRRSDSAIPG